MKGYRGNSGRPGLDGHSRCGPRGRARWLVFEGGGRAAGYVLVARPAATPLKDAHGTPASGCRRRKLGERLKRGQFVAAVGKHGRSTGPHRHYDTSAAGETAFLGQPAAKVHSRIEKR